VLDALGSLVLDGAGDRAGCCVGSALALLVGETVGDRGGRHDDLVCVGGCWLCKVIEVMIDARVEGFLDVERTSIYLYLQSYSLQMPHRLIVSSCRHI
jgi:hypothetical protein